MESGLQAPPPPVPIWARRSALPHDDTTGAARQGRHLRARRGRGGADGVVLEQEDDDDDDVPVTVDDADDGYPVDILA